MKGGVSCVGFWAFCLVLTALPASAQPRGLFSGRLEVAGEGGWLAGEDFGTRDAALRANTPQPSPYRLFSTETRLKGAPFVAVGLDYLVTARVSAEGRFSFSRLEHRASVTADVESAPDTTVITLIDQYLVDGGIAIVLPELRMGPLVPFASAGAGYVRELDEDRFFVESGASYYVGGGVKHALRSSTLGWIRRIGIRADARLRVVTGGIAGDYELGPRGSFSGSVFVSF